MIWHPVSKIVRAFLIERGVGQTWASNVEWSLATAAIPNLPINVVTIFDESAQKKVKTVASGVIEDPVVSIDVRSADPTAGMFRAKLIQSALDGLRNWSWTGGPEGRVQTIRFANARRSRGIFPIGMDENGKWRYNQEFALVPSSIEEGIAVTKVEQFVDLESNQWEVRWTFSEAITFDGTLDQAFLLRFPFASSFVGPTAVIQVGADFIQFRYPGYYFDSWILNSSPSSVSPRVHVGSGSVIEVEA